MQSFIKQVTGPSVCFQITYDKNSAERITPKTVANPPAATTEASLLVFVAPAAEPVDDELPGLAVPEPELLPLLWPDEVAAGGRVPVTLAVILAMSVYSDAELN